LATPQI